MKLLISSLSVAYVLLALYQTNVVAEYAYLFKIKIFKLGEYNQWLKWLEDYYEKMGRSGFSGSSQPHYQSYIEWLNLRYGNNFFVKLLMCPVCLSFWLAFIICLFIGLQYVLAIAFLSNLFYYYCVILKNKAM